MQVSAKPCPQLDHPDGKWGCSRCVLELEFLQMITEGEKGARYKTKQYEKTNQ